MSAAGRQLFAHPYRRERARRPGLASGRKLLGGQALAEAQRLARPRMRAQFVVLFLMVADLVVILFGGLLAWTTGAGLGPSDGRLVAVLWVAALTALAVIRLGRGYRLWRMRELQLSLSHMTIGLVAGLIAAGLLLWWMGFSGDLTSAWLSLWALLSGLGMTAARVLVWYRMRALVRVGLLEHRLVVVGGGATLAPVLQELGRCRREGYRVCGFFDERGSDRSPDVVAGHHKMGDLDSLVEFVRIAQIDSVILAMPALGQDRLVEMLTVLWALPIEVRSLRSTGLHLPPEVRSSRIGALELVELLRPPISGWKAAQKRAFDLVTASVALVLLAPVMVAVAAAVRLDSPGPILFRQLRHGFNNRPVGVLKFRSMHADRCDPTAVKAVRRDDDRVTRVGRFIRRTSLDELPQLFNVLAGDLSMVGPRPHAMTARTGDILFDEVATTYSARHRVKPGITGWAQINGWRGEMNTAEKITERVRHDLYYIENWSLWLDIRILLRTPRALIGAKNAY